MRVWDATSSLIGDEQWPPGFRFHPTDEELVLYYLKRKICGLRLKLDAIAEVDVYKADPEDLPPLSKLKTGDRQWFFFSPKDRKYPSGGRSNRATRLGYWKATGKDRPVTCNSRSVGIKKTLVFYRGRAPLGERTDWVMHEYTIDEEELKRCPARDYYALYKIYKKSGPGPKNGEQYGAPFREEDWADDEKAIDNVGQHHAVSFDSTGTNCVLLNRAINGPLYEPVPEPCSTGTTLVERELQERAIVLPSCGRAQSCFNSTRLESTQFQEISEVTCANNVIKQGSQESDKDIFEDFLEIDDLFGPEPIQQNTDNHVDDLRIEDFDGLCELDLFEDVSMFLPNMDNTEPSFCTYNNNVMNEICNPVSVTCPNNFDNGLGNQVSNLYFNNYPSEMVQPISQPYSFVDNEAVNQFNYEILRDNVVADQRWMPTPLVPNQASVIPPISGGVSGGLNQNQSEMHNQPLNQNGEVNEGEESWLSSSLWSFLETIPTTPASATEGTALVNKTFERLSSFSKMGDSVKVSLLGRNATAGDSNATHRKYRNWYSRGVVFFSFLVLLFAILWAFTETSVRVLLSRCVS